jgi:hypothetical protein
MATINFSDQSRRAAPAPSRNSGLVSTYTQLCNITGGAKAAGSL